MKGAVCGAVATAAMSGVMLAGSRMGLMPDQPPKRIARAMLPGHKHRPKSGEGVAGAMAHFGFGVGAGSLYGLLARGDRTPSIAGVGYALAIWAASYQGWVPGLRILPAATRDLPGRPAVMIAGHIVYGMILTKAMNRLNARTARKADRKRARGEGGEHREPAYRPEPGTTEYHRRHAHARI
ncbi:DUF6789 family protein [Nonomuraea fastidiosa]|jgi:hypothetical protein|uniref:DUF6789 family protein n=1 Tax=Nonomuraea TaxID=83681 RepID=UPI0032552DE1